VFHAAAGVGGLVAGQLAIQCTHICRGVAPLTRAAAYRNFYMVISNYFKFNLMESNKLDAEELVAAKKITSRNL
jgi:hypothetical protein